MMHRRGFLGGVAAAVGSVSLGAADLWAARPARSRPNIIVLMVDDMGYSDVGCFGGEISTPNIDSLAQGGVRFTNFHSTARCCPSRASILTGLWPHQTGMGYMEGTASKPPLPAFQGQMNLPCVTIAEVVKQVGYSTCMSGKWHVGSPDPAGRGFDVQNLPDDRIAYFMPRDFDPKTGPDAYLTDWIGDGVVRHIDQFGGKHPFFIYWAPTAPHWPVQAKASDIAKYRGMYDAGPLAVASERLKRMHSMGIAGRSWPWEPGSDLSKPDTTYRTDVATDQDTLPTGKWTSIRRSADDSANRRKARSFAEHMEIFAAQVDNLDQNVGRIVARLKDKGIYENTLFVFCSDNGASEEGLSTGRSWANVSNTPFQYWKKNAHEGGVASPLIISWPDRISPAGKGTINPTWGHLVDILPTVMDASGAHYPKQDGSRRDIPPCEGRSLLPALAGVRLPLKQPIYIEHGGNRAVITENWKAVSEKGAPWSLFNMRVDRLETNDVAKANATVVTSLSAQWSRWAIRVGAMLTPAAGSDRSGKDSELRNHIKVAGTARCQGTVPVDIGVVHDALISLRISDTTGQPKKKILEVWAAKGVYRIDVPLQGLTAGECVLWLYADNRQVETARVQLIQ